MCVCVFYVCVCIYLFNIKLAFCPIQPLLPYGLFHTSEDPMEVRAGPTQDIYLSTSQRWVSCKVHRYYTEFLISTLDFGQYYVLFCSFQAIYLSPLCNNTDLRNRLKQTVTRQHKFRSLTAAQGEIGIETRDKLGLISCSERIILLVQRCQ